MKILWLTWKDRKHPLAGGAEIVNEELAKRLTKNGYEIIFIVSGFPGAAKKEMINGYKVVRLGNRWTVYWRAYQYYKKHLSNWLDLVIDEINTVPFFAKFYVKTKNILFIHQLCREIWFYEMFFPLNLIGYLLEPVYLWLLRDRKVITVSESTKKDLIRYGFKKENVYVISEGIEIEPLKNLPSVKEVKEKNPTILFLGTLRRMKRPEQVIKAFELVKKKIKNLKLWIAGGGKGRYFKKIMRLIRNSRYKKDIVYFGKVNKKKKYELLLKAHLLCVTSVKEGWGLVVAEANSQGTPAIVYNVDGLRDAVKDNKTGIVCQQNTPENLAQNIIELLRNKEKYDFLRKNAWELSKEITFEKSLGQFKKIVEEIKNE